MGRVVNLGLVLLLALLAARGLYDNGRWLIAQAYLRYAEDHVVWPQGRQGALRAAQMAARLQPSSARALQLQALSQLQLGEQATALSDYQAALRLAPADAFLWRDYALALLYGDVFDQRLQQAVAQAQIWAPRSSPLHQSLAIAGLKVFDRSPPAQQALWLNSIRFAYWEQPQLVLAAAYVSGQELMLCRQVVLQPDSSPWCAAARWRYGQCSALDRQSGRCGGVLP